MMMQNDYYQYLTNLHKKLDEFVQDKKLTSDDMFYLRKDLDKIREHFIFSHDYVLIDNGYIYDINILYTYDFAAPSSGGDEYFIEDDGLYVQTAYADYDYDDLQVTEKSYIGKVLKRSCNLQDLIDDGGQIKKLDNTLYQVITEEERR